MRKLSFCLLLVGFVFVQAQTSTLEAVEVRGELRCGVSDVDLNNVDPSDIDLGNTDLNNTDPGDIDSSEIVTEDGGLAGFYTEMCRAVAAAVLGDQERVVYLPLATSERFAALSRGDVDLLVGRVTETVSRDAEVDFAPVVFHDLVENGTGQHYAPAVRQGDTAWRDTVSWIVNALIQAEEWGVTSENVDSVADTAQSVPMLARFLGLEGDLTTQLGLRPDALRRAVAQTGNYGEIYDRHLGPDATLSLPRGPNRLWSEGGLLYAPPFSTR